MSDDCNGPTDPALLTAEGQSQVNVEETDDSSSQHGFNNMLKHIMKENDIDLQDCDESEDGEILKALEDVEAKDEFGPSIMPHVALAFNQTATRPITKDTNDRLRQGIKIPDNCKAFRVPKVNPEIWSNLRTKSRVTDLKLQQTQGGFSVALTVLASISDEIANAAASKLIPKDVVAKLLKIGMDGANLIGNQMQDISNRRRQEIKPYLNPDYAGICNAQIPASEYLFGDNLADTLKSTKAAASVIRNANLSRHRSHPYSPRGSSLNFQRPFTSSRGRWNGQRSNASYSRPQSFQRPTQTMLPRQQFPNSRGRRF